MEEIGDEGSYMVCLGRKIAPHRGNREGEGYWDNIFFNMINHGMEGVDNRNTISRRVEEDCDILSTLFANALNGIQKFDLASAQWTI